MNYFIIFCVFFEIALGNSQIRPENQLISKLLENYEPRARPIADATRQISVIYDLDLISILEVDAKNQRMR